MPAGVGRIIELMTMGEEERALASGITLDKYDNMKELNGVVAEMV